MNNHQYLNDLGIDSNACCIFNSSDTSDDRMPRFIKQREKFGFDERETWSLDYTLAGWLYSHLKMYLDIGGRTVDMSFHHFDIPTLEEIPEEEYGYFKDTSFVIHYQKEIIKHNISEEDCIKEACKYFEYYLNDSDDEIDMNEQEVRRAECLTCAMKIVTEILPALWW